MPPRVTEPPAPDHALAPGRALRHHDTLLVAFAGGFAIMNAEIAAGRLLAPYFGTSTTTWALLIGTILTSLAVGGLVGGWLSRRGAPERWLIVLLAGAAVLVALLPRVGPWLMAGSLARFGSGHRGTLLVSAGAVALLLAGPMLLLGALSPLVLQVAGRLHPGDRLAPELGSVSGRLYAAGTLGSLVGTFGAGLLFIPWLGTTRTIDVGALALGLTGAWVALRLRSRGLLGAAAGPTLLFLALVVTGNAPGPRPPVGRLVWSGESRYNHVTVVETGVQRQLRVNEGFAIQSVAFTDGRLPLHDVWGFYALAPAWGEHPSPRRVLLLGLGGGTSAEIYRRLYPGARVTGVELDGAIVRAGTRHLGVKLDGVEIVIEDARTFVARAATRGGDRWDVIILDAFQFPYVPFQLTTREFFRQVATCLEQGGVLMVNAGRYGDHRGVVHALGRTLHAVFPYVLAADAPNRSNTLLVATTHDPRRGVGPSRLRVDDRAARQLERLGDRYAAMLPASWPPETPLLTDDDAPVEWLTDRIVWQRL
jgi:spermidine synthase